VGFARDEGGVSILNVDIEVKSTAQLSRLVAKLQSLWSVISVTRKGETIVREQVSR